MKTTSIALLFIALLGTVWIGVKDTKAKSTEDPDRAAIQRVLTDQESSWNLGNVRGFMAGYWNSPDLTFAGANGFTRGWQSVLDRYLKTYKDKQAMGSLSFSELEIRPLGPNAALVLGRWHVQRQSGDIGGIFTLVFQKFPEGWRIVHDHTTQSAPAT